MNNKMAKLFRTSGTGAQQQTLDTTDEKIKIYADDTALDTDLTNIPDGEIVATKESVSGGGSGYVGEIPLGTWASFENDTAPNSEWIQAGTTFDANVYPALAMMLGGNTVPERFDHNRLGDYEDITLPTSSASAITMEYDGVFDIQINGTSGQQTNIYFYVNGNLITQTSKSGTYIPKDRSVFSFKKGDVIYITVSGGSITTKVRYYTHPLFIKATPTSSDSDYEGTLNSIREFYVRNNTYSTEERLTGGVWIDGKPIYRKSFSLGQTSSGTVLVTGVAELVSAGGWFKDSSTDNQTPFPFTGQSGARVPRINSNHELFLQVQATFYQGNIWIEYTKTTD